MRKALSTLLYLVGGLPLALSALMLLSVRPWAVDRDFYEKLVTDERLYAVLSSPELAKAAPALVKRGQLVFDGPALAQALQKNLSAEELKAFGLGAVDLAMDAVEGRAPANRIELDIGPLKKSLESKAPAVARDYVAALATRPGSPAPGDYSFRPESVSVKSAEELVRKALSAALAELPDTASTSLEPRAGSRPPFFPRDGVMTKAALDRGSTLLAVLSAAVLGGLAALGGSGLVRILSRAGKFILLPSVLVLAIGGVLAIPGGLILQGLFPDVVREALGGAAAAPLRGYLSLLLGTIAKGFLITGLVGTSVGGVLASTKRIAEPKEL
jgi:hypothetical protein